MSDSMVAPLQERIEEWKRLVVSLDRDHAKGIESCVKVSLPAVFAVLLILILLWKNFYLKKRLNLRHLRLTWS